MLIRFNFNMGPLSFQRDHLETKLRKKILKKKKKTSIRSKGNIPSFSQ